MTVTLTYDGTFASVDIAVTGLAGADHALVERSTDQVRWSTVRGGSAWPVSAGAFVNTLHDYEFSPGVANYYRVRGLVLGTAPSFVAAATAFTASSGSIVGLAKPAGVIDGDAVLVEVSTRNSGTGTVDTPTGWTKIAESGNLALLGRIYDSAVWTAIPTITFTGGAANEDTLAQSAAFRGIGITALTSNPQLNSSAQNVAYPLANLPANAGDTPLALILGWKQDDWSDASTPAGYTEIGNPTSAAGNDASQCWDYQLNTAGIAAGSFTITGGASAISRSISLILPRQAFLNEQTNNIAPVIAQPWLKSVARPNLNLPVAPDAQTSGPTWTDRSAVFPIKGRSLPIGVTDLRGGRELELCLQTDTLADGETLRLGQMFGDTVYLQVPPGYPELATGYYVVGPLRRDNRDKDPASGAFWWNLPLREVAAPAPGVVGVTVTCADIAADFVDCNAVVAAFATCAAVLDYVAAPADILVP